MAHRPRTIIVRMLAASLTTATLLLAFATPAAAQVSIVPDHVTDGGTKTFAFRFADERRDTAGTRIELVFPPDLPVAYVQVEAVPGWTATITPRPLNPPVRVNGKTIDEVAGSVVLQGGSVAPDEFQTFPITMGPLPTNGKLTFDATETFANGEVRHLTGALAPVITFGDVPAPAATIPADGQITMQPDGASSSLPVKTAPITAPGSGSSRSPLTVLWGSLGLAIAIVAAVWFRARRARRRLSMMDPETDFDLLPAADSTVASDDETEGASR